MKKLLSLLLALALVFCLFACGDVYEYEDDDEDDEEETEETEETTESAGDETTAGTQDSTESVEPDTTQPEINDGIVTYIVKVVDENNTPMAGVMVQLCLDVCVPAVTDANGVATFYLPAADYKVTFINLPEGYFADAEYYFSAGSYEMTIVLKSVENMQNAFLVTGEDISAAELGLGDVMYDFTITKPDGTEITLSEVLQEKKVAVLNFWYTTCIYCIQEFPLMQSAYEQYSDNALIIALNPLNPNQEVANFQASYGLTFDMASCPASWANAFNVRGYPTTVVVDRYGRICLVEVGALLEKNYWTAIFDHFTADDYEQILLTSVSELLY